MAVLVPLGEIAVGDYSAEYGTVREVVDRGDLVTLRFINGQEITQPKEEELEFDQGGRF